MGIRETMREQPAVVSGASAGVLVVAIALILWQLASGQENVAAARSDQAYYTIDDGKTFFAADATKIPPFLHEGKPAVKAYVFRCGSKEFVGYLMRYTPASHQSLEAAAAPNASGNTKLQAAARTAMRQGAEIKRPGEMQWIQQLGSKQATEMMNVKCPDGSGDVPQPVVP